MDPDANLRAQLLIAQRIVDASPGLDAERLAELVLALHDWITCGGFLPAAWCPPPTQGRTPTVKGGL